MQAQRRTQAERREETSKQVLTNAVRLFGERGYTETSLEDIAIASRVTTRPIFHYFGNKKSLFAAVNAVMEERIVATMGADEPWAAFLDLCEDARFRQVVLVDGPVVLGRDRWQDSAVTTRLRGLMSADTQAGLRAEMQLRMVMGALSEAALLIATSDEPARLREVAEELGPALFATLTQTGTR